MSLGYRHETPTGTFADGFDVAAPLESASAANSDIQVTAWLTTSQVTSGLNYNQKKNYPAAVWQQIATVVGTSEASLTAALVQAIAEWQDRMGLDPDGKCGDITMEWMSQEPGGEGLGRYVVQDTTLFMGLNPDSKGAEFNALQGQMRSQLMSALGSDQHQDQVQVAGKWASLTDDEGLAQALLLLPGLPSTKAAEIIDYLNATGNNVRDEMFLMIRALWAAETGVKLIKRVVFSGHSNGDDLWGGEGMEFGVITYGHLMNVFRMFPRAASQVEDLALSACNSGWSDSAETYRSALPNLKTVWAYAGYSPSASTGSTRHLSKWEQGTRGHGDDGIEVARTDVASGSGSKDQNVATWSESGGYQTNAGKSHLTFEELRSQVEQRRPVYDAAYLDGRIDQNALDLLQGDLQALVRTHGDALGGDRAEYALMNVRTLFLRHWSTITSGFVAKYGAIVAEGFEEMGSSIPPFETMSRAQVLNLVAHFVGEGEKSIKAQKIMAEVLRDLDPAQVPYGQGSVTMD